MADAKTKELAGNPEEAARLRAAFAYADLDLDGAADVLGVSKRTVSRYLNAETWPADDPWPKVLEATRLPAWFAAAHFEPEPDAPKLVERVEALEHQIAALVRRFGGDAPPSPADELLRPPEVRQPKRSSGSGEASAPGRGARRGSG